VTAGRAVANAPGAVLPGRVGRRLLVLAAAVAGVLLPAGPAAAHATLLATVPATGYAGAGPVRQVVLVFDEPVTVTAHSVRVTDAAGRRVPGAAVRTAAGGRQLTLPLTQQLTAGQFIVRWQVTAADGDVVDGSFSFGVDTTAPSLPGGAGTGRLPGTAALRWVLFAALSVASGGLVGERLTAWWRAGRDDLPMVRAPVAAAALAGALAAAGLAALLASSTGGLGTLLAARGARLGLVESAAFLLSARLAAAPRTRPGAGLGLLAVLVAEGLRAHPQSYLGGAGVALTVVHLGAAAVWVGALAHVVRAARRWRHAPTAARALVRGYAQLALALFLTVVATGTLAALVVLPSWRALAATGYGWTLLAKLGLVAAAAVLAVLGRRRAFSARPRPGPEPGFAPRIERAALVGVLAATAGLVTLPAPRPAATALTLPPPPSGPRVDLGTLVGQLSVGLTASDGQLVVQVSAPGTDPGEPGGDDAGYRVTAALTGPAGEPTRLPLLGCGPGCFLAAPAWPAGVNRLDLTTGAARWHGGTTRFTLPWPPSDGRADFGRVLTALRAAGRLTLLERVTSDTTGPQPAADRIPLSARDFLRSEPYGNGGVPVVAALPPAGGLRQLAVAYPTIGVYITFQLGPDNLPRRQVEATPDHLITREFDYR